MTKKDDKNNPPIDKTEENTYIDDVLFEETGISAGTEEKIKGLKENSKNVWPKEKGILMAGSALRLIF